MAKEAPPLRPAQFAFQTVIDLKGDNWPALIWAALAAAGGVKGPVQSFDHLARHPEKLSGKFQVAANVLSIKAPKPKAMAAQRVTLSFAAFDPKTGKVVGWSRDHSGESSDPGSFSGDPVVKGKPVFGKGVTISEAFLKKLLLEGKRLRKAGAGAMAHDADVNALAFTADGSQLVSFGNDFTLRVWDAKSCAAAGKTKLHRFTSRFTLARGVVAADGPDCKLRSLDTGKPSAKFSSKQAFDGVVFSADGKLLIAGAGKQVIVYDLKGTVVRSTDVGAWIHDVASAPDGRVAALTDAPAIVVIDPKGGASKPIAVPVNQRCAWTPAGLFAWNGELVRVDVVRGRSERIVKSNSILCVSPDGTLAAMAGPKDVEIVSTKTGKTVKKLALVKARAAALDAANARLAIASGKNISIVEL